MHACIKKKGDYKKILYIGIVERERIQYKIGIGHNAWHIIMELQCLQVDNVIPILLPLCVVVAATVEHC